MSKLFSRLKRVKKYAYKILILNELRHYFCMLRWFFLKKHLVFLPNPGEDNPKAGIEHNLSAFKNTVSFGMHNRMAKLLYPVSTLVEIKSTAKILILGPRTEDDIFLCKSLGLHDCIGLDLFSYSPLIKLGDMHSMSFPDEEFDVVVLGWVIAYSSSPQKAANEIIRVTKTKGFIAIGWEWVEPRKKFSEFNLVNSVQDHLDLFKGNTSICHINDHEPEVSRDKCLVLKKQPAQHMHKTSGGKQTQIQGS